LMSIVLRYVHDKKIKETFWCYIHEIKLDAQSKF
jgi:hypothetical protein